MKKTEFLKRIRSSVPAGVRNRIQSNRFLSAAARSMAALLLITGGRHQSITRGPAEGILLSVNSHITEQYLLGDYEPPIQQFIWNHLRPGDTFYDLGASIGFFTLLGAKRVGPGGRVYAFEPAPHAYDTLCRQIRINRFSWAVPFREVLTDVPKKVSFAVTSNAYGSSIVEPGHRKWHKLEILADNLDNISARESLAPPSLLKIDVENEEGRVLSGAEKLLKSARPGIICEIHSIESGREVVRILEALGYRCGILGLEKGDAREVIEKMDESGQVHLVASHPNKG